jgi:hypothetical protein
MNQVSFAWLRMTCCVVIFGGIMACESSKPADDKKKAMVGDTAKFYPINQFIADEMRYVDLRNFLIQENLVTNKDTVSRNISKDEFLAAANEQLQQANWFMAHKDLFTESIFQDLGTDSYTINYTSTNANIKHIDLLLNQQTNLPKRLFIRYSSKAGDTTITQQYSWIANQQFGIGRSLKTNTGYAANSNKTILWKKQD